MIQVITLFLNIFYQLYYLPIYYVVHITKCGMRNKLCLENMNLAI